MDSQRTRLLLGLGVSVFGVVLTWVLFRALKKSKPKNPLSVEPVSKGENHVEEKPRENFEDDDFSSLDIAPPLAYSSESDLRGKAEMAGDTVAGEQSFTDELAEMDEGIEETIIPTTAADTACTVNLDDTVTLHSSDLMSESYERSDLSLLADSDVMEVKHEKGTVSSDDANGVDSLRIQGEPAVEYSTSNDIVHDIGEVMNKNTSQKMAEMKVSADSLNAISSSNTENSSAYQEAEALIEEIVTPQSVAQLNASLNEIQTSVGTAKGAPIEAAQFAELEAAAVKEVGTGFHESDEDLSAVKSSASAGVDSGVGMASSGSRADDHVDSNLRSDNGSAFMDDKEPNMMDSVNSKVIKEPNGMSALAGHVSPPASTAPTHQNGTGQSAHGGDSKLNGGTHPAAAEAMSTQTPAAVTNGHGSAHPPPRVVHTFLMPANLCGIFIGKSGRNVSALKRQTNTEIKIGREPVMAYFRYCTVEGIEADVARTLRLIKKQYPKVDTTSINEITRPANPTLSPDRMQLHLPMGVLADVIISDIVSGGHVFVQQPTHPSFLSWQRLSEFMNNCYGDGTSIPPLPDSVEDDVLCVALLSDGWQRAHIMSFSSDRQTCELKLVDKGGYAVIATSQLRQIRQDFLSLPFQAVECYLANIEPLDGQEFSTEAYEALREMTFGKAVQCQPVAVAGNNVPYIHVISAGADGQVLVVNRELARRGLVNWYDLADG